QAREREPCGGKRHHPLPHGSTLYAWATVGVRSEEIRPTRPGPRASMVPTHSAVRSPCATVVRRAVADRVPVQASGKAEYAAIGGRSACAGWSDEMACLHRSQKGAIKASLRSVMRAGRCDATTSPGEYHG